MKQLEDRFFVIDLNKQYDVDLVNDDTITYFICQHITDEKTIKNLGATIYNANVRYACFFGKNESLWHLWFDEASIDITGWDNADIKDEDVFMTSSYETIDEFVDWICLNKKYCRTYLFYDDKMLFDKVIDKINNWSLEDETA